MAIISEDSLRNELPDDATDTKLAITKSVSQASVFVNSWALDYELFDEVDSSTGEEQAPDVIVRLCLDVASIYYRLIINESNLDGNERQILYADLEIKRNELKKIQIEPEINNKTISLTSSTNAMLVNRLWHVIPQTAYITSATTNVWNYNEDWYIARGGINNDEYQDSWYLYANSSSVEGTLYFHRSFRKDAIDYMKASQYVNREVDITKQRPTL